MRKAVCWQPYTLYHILYAVSKPCLDGTSAFILVLLTIGMAQHPQCS